MSTIIRTKKHFKWTMSVLSAPGEFVPVDDKGNIDNPKQDTAT